MLIAIPSDAPGGLDATIAEHFGHCAAFTLVEVADGEIGQVTVLDNAGHEQGGCLAPVTLLEQRGVEAMVAGGMGMRPLAGFRSVGITVYLKGDATTVKEAVERYVAGDCTEFGRDQTCGGGGRECGSHHHQPVERDPVEGKADVRKDRIVSIDFRLTDGDGQLLDSSDESGTLSYLHGHQNMVPGLEKALEGLEAGAHKVVEVPAAEAYGQRDESRVIEMPRQQLPEDAFEGAIVHGQLDGGQVVLLTVVELDDERAKLDANHPLAGKDLVFDVTVVRVEQATAEEIAHGHAF